MKQVLLGDIHGRAVWKTIINRHEDADRIIFIGDYVDTHEDITPEEQLNNLKEIIEFKKTSKIPVILLIGNHDYHYMNNGLLNEKYSGYQPQMYQSFNQIFTENEKLFQICFEDEFETLYSHAGVTHTFVKNLLSKRNLTEGKLEVTPFLNECFQSKPGWFGFSESDRSGYGQSVTQSCIWVRPDSLYSDQIDCLQVVGHTTVNKINHPAKSERRGFYLVDALPRQYLVRVDEEFKIENV